MKFEISNINKFSLTNPLTKSLTNGKGKKGNSGGGMRREKGKFARGITHVIFRDRVENILMLLLLVEERGSILM